MAVIKGISISIQVNKQALQEYDDIDETDQRDKGNGMPCVMSKYIEATTGARFTIKSVVPKSVKKVSDGLSFKIYLDGVYVESEAMRMDWSKLKRGVWQRRTEGLTKVTKAGKVKRPFLFSEIKCSEDAPPTPQHKQKKISAEGLGMIMVKVWRKKNWRPGSKKKVTDFKGNLNNAEEMNEKELKGKNLTHSVSLGEEEKGGLVPQWWKSDHVDGEDSPFAIFTFKYCSKKGLQSLLLIRRTPSPTPAPPPVPLEERPEDELTNEELRELARRQRARFQVERKANVKPEPGIKAEFGIKSERGIKRDRDDEVEGLVPSSSAKKVKGPIANGEIVDLSD